MGPSQPADARTQTQKPKETESETARHGSTSHLQEALWLPVQKARPAGQNLARKRKGRAFKFRDLNSAISGREVST